MIPNTKNIFSKFSASVDNFSVSQLHANVCSLTCSRVISFGLYAMSVLAYKTRFNNPWSNYWIYIPIEEYSYETQTCVELRDFWWAGFLGHILGR